MVYVQAVGINQIEYTLYMKFSVKKGARQLL